MAADEPQQVIRGSDAERRNEPLFNQSLFPVVGLSDSCLRRPPIRGQFGIREAHWIVLPDLFGRQHPPDQQPGRTMIMHQRLLLLSCSQRKRSDSGLLPAIERYDGPLFRVLRRYQRGFSAADSEAKPLPDVYILSAQYGLISGDHPVADYEQRMTAERANELRPRVVADLQDLLDPKTRYHELFFCMGRDYRRVFEGWETRRPPELSVVQAEGSIGGKQAQLHDWLHGAPPAKPTNAHKNLIGICGVEINVTAQQALQTARQALRDNGKGAADYRMWYVLVDDQRVSPKWLISQLTQLPVSKFHSDSARHVLTQLGLEIQRVGIMPDEEVL